MPKYVHRTYGRMASSHEATPPSHEDMAAEERSAPRHRKGWRNPFSRRRCRVCNEPIEAL